MYDLPRSTVKITHSGEGFEVTTFRGLKRGAGLEGAGLDATMRDFTMNALYYDPTDDCVLDFVGGVTDLQKRTLRLTCDPVARLVEDPIRVLRGVRFAALLGLKLSPDSAQAMVKMAYRCSVAQGKYTAHHSALHAILCLVTWIRC